MRSSIHTLGVIFLGLTLAACAPVEKKPETGETSAGTSACEGLPSHADLKAALTKARQEANGGFNLDMWGTIVNRDGVVCAVAFTGGDRGDQWPDSRVISGGCPKLS